MPGRSQIVLRDDFHAFTPALDLPLVVSFVTWCRSIGLTPAVEFGNWDFLVYEGSKEPLMAVKSIRNDVSDGLMARLVTEPAPIKVLLVEGAKPDLEHLRELTMAFAATGTGIFVRDVGWIVLPGRPMATKSDDLRFKLAPRWNQDPDGTWRKACSKCGELKTPEGFYRSQYRTSKDPTRHICKECFHQKEEPCPPAA
jgi:hypothetical protein